LSLIEKERKPDVDELQQLQIKVESLIFTANPLILNFRPYFIKLVSSTH